MATSSNKKSEETKVLYLIDGHAQFFRAYYAIRSGLKSPVTGEPTNMTFGFFATLLKLLREQPPDYLAVVIDVSGDREGFRSELYPEYKANRRETPEDFHPQVERCLQVLQQMRVPILGEERYEADDVIATLARRLTSEHPNLEIRILSRDKDLAQLITDRVELFDPQKEQPVTPEQLFETPGVKPEHVVDILSLMGDTSDNVPGVPGIGPKTAAQLILEFGSIDNLLAHLDRIKGKKRENLEASRDQIPLSRQLVTLRDDVPVSFELDQARYDPQRIDVGGVLTSFRELGFHRHQDDLKALVNAGEPSSNSKQGAMQTQPNDQPGEACEERGFADSLFTSQQHTPSRRGERGAYEAVTTLKQLDSVIRRVCDKGQCAIDTETTSLAAVTADLCGVCIAIEPRSGWYIPTRSPDMKSHLSTQQVVERLKPLLEDESVAKVGHNLKYDIIVLRSHGIRLRGKLFDTMVASYVIDATRSSHSMDVLALALLDYTPIPISELIGKGKDQRTFDTVPLPQATEYAAEDADVTLRLRDVMEPHLASMRLRALFDEVEMPLVDVLAELEFNGILVDPAELDRQRMNIQKRIDALRQQIIDAAPHAFNPDSPKQLAAVLFNKPGDDPPGLGLKVTKRGKTGPSTDVEVLERIAADPAIDSTLPEMIVEYRQLAKLVNTYLVALKDAINPKTHRVHASFHQTVAATGRLSSSDPNLQNIPIRSDMGREIRRAFRAESGRVLLTADYSQIELRILAHLSEDPALIEAFERGDDIHVAVAAEVFGVPQSQVTRAQRDSAKMVNFGIVYGITPYGLARRLGPGATVKQAEEIITSYKSRFHRIDLFLASCVHQAESLGYVETILKRRRRVPQIHSRNPQERGLGERIAINTVVQGSAADLIKLAMIHLHRDLSGSWPDVRMLLQIHDELVFEVPSDLAPAVQPFVVQHMQQAMSLRVPLVVESAWSECWVDVK